MLTCTLHRPDRLNAFNTRMWQELLALCDEVDANDDVRVLVLTGAGRGFCAGADLGDADLWGTTLRKANLHGCDLRGADLSDVDLGDADLRDAAFHGADLGSVKSLVQAQLDHAWGDEKTMLPQGLTLRFRPEPASTIDPDRN